MSRCKSRIKGPIVMIQGQQTRALPDGYLMTMKESLAQEVLYWRGQVLEKDQAMSVKQTELDKAEATIRNLEHEIRKLRRAIAEAESKFGEVWSR